MDDAIVIEVEIAAAPERVFDALTDPAQLAAWWNAAGGGASTSWELDLRVGGKWRARGWDESCGHWVTEGEVVELDPPRVLAYTWTEHLENSRPFGETVVRYELQPTAAGTRLRLTHSGFGEHREAFDSYRSGWTPLMAQLRAFAEGAVAAAGGALGPTAETARSRPLGAGR